MNRNAPSIPSLSSLYWNDSIFSGAVKVCGFAVVVAAGFWWLGQPMPNALPAAGQTFEASLAKKVPPIALGVAGLALLVAVWRTLRVRKIFVEGEIVPGTVVEMKTETWQTSANVDQSHGSRTKTMRSYYVTIHYKTHGIERTLRQKLFHSGDTYGLTKGGPVELMMLDSSSGKPLIRAVYLTKLKSMKWWKWL